MAVLLIKPYMGILAGQVYQFDIHTERALINQGLATTSTYALIAPQTTTTANVRSGIIAAPSGNNQFVLLNNLINANSDMQAHIWTQSESPPVFLQQMYTLNSTTTQGRVDFFLSATPVGTVWVKWRILETGDTIS